MSVTSGGRGAATDVSRSTSIEGYREAVREGGREAVREGGRETRREAVREGGSEGPEGGSEGDREEGYTVHVPSGGRGGVRWRVATAVGGRGRERGAISASAVPLSVWGPVQAE